MADFQLYDYLLAAFFLVALVTFFALFFVQAPYGRYTRENWGPRVKRAWGWVVMEAPSPLGMVLLFSLGAAWSSPAAVAFLLLWLVHYLHRAFIFPFRMRGGDKQITLVTVALGLTFNLWNSYLNGHYLFELAHPYPSGWLADPRFWGGACLFLLGWGINIHSDTILIHLRRPGQSGYVIPRGGLFRWVSCPNYLGEIVEWGGWALVTWSLPGLGFAIWTAANLGPRAISHHRWYQKKFPEYPAGRRALLPFVL